MGHNWDVTQVIAHRGASAAEPENSLAAFLRAVEMGSDAVELDVRRTADGVLVVHHDPITSTGQRIENSARRELAADIAHLEDALAACGGIAVNLEIKAPERDGGRGDDRPNAADHGHQVVDETMALLESLGGGPRWVVSSFSEDIVARAGNASPRVRTALLCERAEPSDIEVALAARCWGIHPGDRWVTRSFVNAAHGCGLAVNVWTVDDPSRQRELMAWGVDGIITNVPDVAITVRERPA